MKIKKRLFISNIVTVLITLVITIVATFGFFFFSARLDISRVNTKNVEDVVNKNKSLSDISAYLIDENHKMKVTSEIQKYLDESTLELNGKYILYKNQNDIIATQDINRIDVERIMNESNSTIDINGENYMSKVTDFQNEDGSNGKLILLVPISKETFAFKNFLIFITIAFIVSFVIANFITTYSFVKRIMHPINYLKAATSNIRDGNLDSQIIEDGDEEIKELCNDFEIMRVRLKDSVTMKNKYDENRKLIVSSISHDLKTPITSIKGYVEGILDGVANTEEKVFDYLKIINMKADYMNIIIDDLLLHSKLDLNQIPYNFESTDIVNYFEDCICECEGELKKYNIDMSLDNQLVTTRLVKIDREKLRRVIINIIDNARKYMDKEHGKINIELRETNASIIIEIRDNGMGIDEEEVNKIFNRFYRIDKSRNETKGSGLGLAIAKQIVEDHKGRIWAISHGNEGTSILMTLGKNRGNSADYEEDTNSGR